MTCISVEAAFHFGQSTKLSVYPKPYGVPTRFMLACASLRGEHPDCVILSHAACKDSSTRWQQAVRLSVIAK